MQGHAEFRHFQLSVQQSTIRGWVAIRHGEIDDDLTAGDSPWPGAPLVPTCTVYGPRVAGAVMLPESVKVLEALLNVWEVVNPDDATSLAPTGLALVARPKASVLGRAVFWTGPIIP
jgi:hypothetical protein